MVSQGQAERQRRAANLVRVAYQGCEGSYTEQAAARFFEGNDDVELVPMQTLDAVLRAVEDGTCKSAILPMENSLSGLFARNLDRLLQHRLHIVGEYIMHDDCNLIALPGVREEQIRNVLSHSHVLDRCETYLGRLNAAVTPTTDTVSAANYIKIRNLTDSAMIGSARLAEMMELEILARDIDDDSNSSTRYVLVERNSISVPPGISSKTTVVVSLTNRTGSMFKALGVFAMRDINILKIETRPSSRAGGLHNTHRPWEYVNLIDVEGSIGEDKIKHALANLEEFANSVRVLGCYPTYTPHSLPPPRPMAPPAGGNL